MHGMTWPPRFELIRTVGLAAILVKANSQEGLLLDRLAREEVSFLDCLAARLPEETNVAASGEVFGKFHRHPIVWPNRTESTWHPPEIVLCDEGERLEYEYFRYDCGQLLKSTIDQGLKEAVVGDFRISYTPQVESAVGACLYHKPHHVDRDVGLYVVDEVLGRPAKSSESARARTRSRAGTNAWLKR